MVMLMERMASRRVFCIGVYATSKAVYDIWLN